MEGAITPNTIICLAGQDDWKQISSDTGLYNFLKTAMSESIDDEDVLVDTVQPTVFQTELLHIPETIQTETFTELMNLQNTMQREPLLKSKDPTPVNSPVHQDLIESKGDDVLEPIKDVKTLKKEERKEKRKRKNEEKKENQIKKPKQDNSGEWYDPKINSNVYVTGLPPTLTLEEFVDPFTKYGMLKIDLETKGPRAKLYHKEDGSLKGDGIISYLRPESVDLAIQFLDHLEIKPGYPISVQRAEFTKKEHFVPQKKSNKTKIKDTRLNWEVDVGRVEEVGVSIVILKNMFDLKAFGEDPLFEPSLKSDIRDEGEKFGKIEKIRVFKKNPEGVIQIRFSNATAAKACVEAFQGRFFDEKTVQASLWDGKTKYNLNEEDLEDDEQRWQEFGNELNRKNVEEIEKLKDFDVLE
jgi:HIV Tat-specific factor 1